MESWGKSANIDIYDCDPELIKSAAHIQDYVIQLCKLIDMIRYGDCQVVRFGTGNKEGYSMFQLIETSNISGHFSEELNIAFIDIFSCKDYNVKEVKEFTQDFFKGKSAVTNHQLRGLPLSPRQEFYNEEEGS